MNFNNYKLIPYSDDYNNEVINFIDTGYKSIGYSHLELDTLDIDLTEITKNYSAPSCFLLLLDGEKLIGTCAVKIYPEKKESELKRVFIDPEYRGQGLGKELSEWAFDYAKGQGAELMHIWSGTYCKTAHKLYKQLGAKDIGVMRHIGGVDNCYERYFIKEL